MGEFRGGSGPLYRIPQRILSLQGKRQAQLVDQALNEAISTERPTTIWRKQLDATIYLDPESAAELPM